MNKVETRYGTLNGVVAATFHPGGGPRDCQVVERNELTTPWGTLVPQYLSDDLRRPRLVPMEFFEDGQLKAIALEERAVIGTPAGQVTAELVTFHPNGALRRVFPLNGKPSGYWSWRKERDMAEVLDLDTPSGRLRTRVMNLLFFPGGALRSITLWPEDTVHVQTPVGPMTVRVGLAWFESGALRSVEPAGPVAVDTPVGSVTAYHTDPEGITGDVNSLGFDERGRVSVVHTASDRVLATLADGTRQTFAPKATHSPCGGPEQVTVPLSLRFEGDLVRFDSGPILPLASTTFSVEARFSRALDIPYHCQE